MLAAARQAFGVQGGDIILVTEAGQELDSSATLAQSGVAAGARLIMRARVVQGG